MSSTYKPDHPQQIYTPGWHGEARTPIIDGKYHDRTTGELQTASGVGIYSGPPAVDIVIKSQHADTSHCGYRAALPFPMEALLCQIMRVVKDRKLGLDSLMATTYSIRVVLAHELTEEMFLEVASEMAQGIWDQK